MWCGFALLWNQPLSILQIAHSHGLPARDVFSCSNSDTTRIVCHSKFVLSVFSIWNMVLKNFSFPVYCQSTISPLWVSDGPPSPVSLGLSCGVFLAWVWVSYCIFVYTCVHIHLCACIILQELSALFLKVKALFLGPRARLLIRLSNWSVNPSKVAASTSPVLRPYA